MTCPYFHGSSSVRGNLPPSRQTVKKKKTFSGCGPSDNDKVNTTHLLVFSANFVYFRDSSPEGDGPHLEVLQYQGNPWGGRSKLLSTSRSTKIEVIARGQCPHTSYYTRKNSYFYLILAKRPRSDTLIVQAAVFIPTNCTFHLWVLCPLRLADSLRYECDNEIHCT